MSQPCQQNREVIVVIDNDHESLEFYHRTLGIQYQILSFANLGLLNNFNKDSMNLLQPRPKLVIADPKYACFSEDDFYKNFFGNEAVLRSFEFLIVTELEDLDLIRFYLKAGARDYILKPIRANELVAKIEYALNDINNREVLLLHNKLDGKQIDDLTFREHQILTVFINHPKRTIHREVLHGMIWNKVNVNRKTLDVHLFNLRRKLRPHGYDIVYHQQTYALQAMR